MTPGLREIYGIESNDKKANHTDEVLKKLKISSMPQLETLFKKKTKEMRCLAEKLEFEKAAEVRDVIQALKDTLVAYGGKTEGPN